jgi:uncharacterized protein (TIGR02246 family)
MDLVITRTFDAPRALVFKAWTDPELGKAWSAPQGFTVPHSQGDLRPGGAWRLSMRKPGEPDLWVGGVYREVVEPERLVSTHAWEDAQGRPGHETLMTVVLAERGGKTEMTFRQAGFESAEARDDHAGGWSECFDKLERLLPTVGRRATDEAQIRALVEEWAKAVRAKDINRRMSNYPADLVLFDVVNRCNTWERMRSENGDRGWFSSFEAPIGYEVRDLRITTGDDTAFSHSLNHVSATKTDGQKIDMWWRATICYRKLDGQWMVAYEHNSVPFDAESGKASLNLKP